MSNKIQYLSVVDDELDIMALFKDALSQMEDTNVCGFTDSTLALEHFKLNQSNYCLILSDFRMPNIDGMDMAKESKNNQSIG